VTTVVRRDARGVQANKWLCVLAVSLLVAPGISGAQQSPDAQAMDQLRVAGSNLRRPHNIEFFLYVPSQLAAVRVAEKVRALEFTIRIEHAATGSDWLVVATKKMIPTEAKLTELRKLFNEIVAAEQGEYDGWGVPLVK
jgi:hypothetical protein